MIMNIDVEWIHSLSGLDCWMTSLAAALRKQPGRVHVRSHNRVFRYLPCLSRAAGLGDILYTNSWEGAFLNRGRTKPMVVTEQLVVHDPLYGPVKTRSQKLFHGMVRSWERQSFRHAAGITAPSDYVRNRLREVFDVDSEVIPNGIDLDLFRPARSEEIAETGSIHRPQRTVLLFAGNATPRKGWPLLVSLMRALGDDFLLRAAVGWRSARGTMPENVSLVRRCPREELPSFYRGGDIFVFPSRLEGFGLAVAEAMACGLPVVASSSSSLPELIVDGKGGFLCEPDNPGDFLEKVRRLARNRSMREDFGRFNRERCRDRFDLKIAARRHRSYFESVSEAPGSRL